MESGSSKMSGIGGLNVLPDSLLSHILSYLPTKEAVRSCQVSKRWKNVWTYLPILDFDFADFWSENIFSRGRHMTHVSEHSECHENFVRFIDGVLASRQIQKVDSFRLVWKYQVKNYLYRGHPVRRWMLLILQQRPRVLSIYVQPSVASVDLPDTTFTCSSLEEMELQIDSRWPLVLESVLVDLPRLRRLNLGYYTIKGDFMNGLLLGCPNLEELELYACGLNLSQIYCGNLKSLILDGCCNFREIRVSIPTLQYLKVTVMSCQTAGIVLENMSSLVKACICFLTANEFEKEFYNSEAKILNGLSGVSNLDVVLHGLEAEGMLGHALTNCPDFKNLKGIHFESFDGYLFGCVDMINCFMHHSPILEDLTFHCCEDGSNKIELLEELREVVSEHGSCQLVECNQACVYDSLDKLKKQLVRYMMRFEKMEMEIAAEEEEDDDVGGGEAWWEEEEED